MEFLSFFRENRPLFKDHTLVLRSYALSKYWNCYQTSMVSHHSKLLHSTVSEYPACPIAYMLIFQSETFPCFIFHTKLAYSIWQFIWNLSPTTCSFFQLDAVHDGSLTKFCLPYTNWNSCECHTQWVGCCSHQRQVGLVWDRTTMPDANTF